MSEVCEEYGESNFLSHHYNCAAHILNLIGQKDSIEKCQDDSIFVNLKEATFKKLTKLWNLQNQSTVFAEKIRESLPKHFKTPATTRWNSSHDCESDFLRTYFQNSLKVISLMNDFQLQLLDPQELQFLEEHHKVLNFCFKIMNSCNLSLKFSTICRFSFHSVPL